MYVYSPVGLFKEWSVEWKGGITPVGAPVIHDYSEWSYHKSFQQ